MRAKSRTRKLTNPVKQRKLRVRMQKGLLIAKIFVILAIFAIGSLIYLNSTRISENFYQITANLGFIVKDITVEGQKYTSNEKIAKVLKIKPGAAIFSIALKDIKARLEALEWIKYVIVERKLPNAFHISVVERTPIALGQKDRKLYIIDDEGAIINEKEIKPHLHLPIIIGDGAEIYASSLIKMLKIEPDLFNHVTSIIRISERRWNIRFDNDLEVKMPEEKIEEAWQTVIKLYKKDELLKPEISSLDLRVKNKIFVEKR